MAKGEKAERPVRNDDEKSHEGRVAKGTFEQKGATEKMKSPKLEMPSQAKSMENKKLTLPDIDAPTIGTVDTWDQRRDRAALKKSKARG